VRSRLRISRRPAHRGKIIDVAEALGIVVDDALLEALFISSIPGKLALHRDHEWVRTVSSLYTRRSTVAYRRQGRLVVGRPARSTVVPFGGEWTYFLLTREQAERLNAEIANPRECLYRPDLEPEPGL
jgi:hypothetical protein